MPTKIGIDKDSPEFDSADEAAHALCEKFSAGKSKSKEQAGVLYRTPEGKYKFSEGITGANDNFQLAAQVPKGHTLAGIVHTHPGNDAPSQVFSPNDVSTANTLKLPSYIRFQSDGSTRRYTPGVTNTDLSRIEGMIGQQKTARGDPVQIPAPAAPTQTASASQPQTVQVEGHSMSDPAMSGVSNNLSGPASQPGASTPSVSSLYTQNPGTQNATAATAATPTPVTSQNATAGTVGTGGVLSQAKNYSAAQNTVDPNQLASTQLADITSQDSPLMEQARQTGLDTANSRGFLNSTLAGGAAEAEMVKAATPIAQQNAATEAQSSLANQAATNAASAQGAQLETQTSEQNATVQAQIQELQAQMQTAVSQGNAQQANQLAAQLQQLQTQTEQFNAAQKTAVSQSNTQQANAMTSQVLQANSDLNKQFLAGTQSMDLATIQGRYQNLISQNAAAASLYNSYFQSISQTMADTNLDPARAAQIVAVQQQTLASGLQLMDTMNNLDLGTGTTAPGGAPVGGAAPGTAAPGSPTGFNIQPVSPTAAYKNPSTAGGEAAPGAAASTAAAGLTGLGTLATGASKTDIANNMGASDTLSTVGKVAGGAGGAAQIVGGVQQGGVKGAGGVLAGGAQLANALGYGGTTTNAVGMVGNLASGNYIGAVQNAAHLFGGSTGAAPAGSTAATNATGTVVQGYTQPAAYEAAQAVAPEAAAESGGGVLASGANAAAALPAGVAPAATAADATAAASTAAMDPAAVEAVNAAAPSTGLGAAAGAAAAIAIPAAIAYIGLQNQQTNSGLAFTKSLGTQVNGKYGGLFTQDQYNQIQQQYHALGEDGFWQWFNQAYPGITGPATSAVKAAYNRN